MQTDDLNHEDLIGPNVSNTLMIAALWLVSATLTLMVIFALREVFIWTLGVVLSPSGAYAEWQAKGIINVTHYCFVVSMGLVGLGLVVFTSERAFREKDQAKTLRSLLRLIVVQALIVVPVALLFWR